MGGAGATSPSNTNTINIGNLLARLLPLREKGHPNSFLLCLEFVQTLSYCTNTCRQLWNTIPQRSKKKDIPILSCCSYMATPHKEDKIHYCVAFNTSASYPVSMSIPTIPKQPLNGNRDSVLSFTPLSLKTTTSAVTSATPSIMNHKQNKMKWYTTLKRGKPVSACSYNPLI